MDSSHDVAVLAGGLSFEREVSLSSGTRVSEALQRVGVNARVADVGGDLLTWIAQDRPDVAVIALHGAAGEDGTIQELLDLNGVPYVGASAGSCRLAYDKPTAKELVRRSGVSTPLCVSFADVAFRDFGARRILDDVIARLGFPLVVKPARGGSSLGVHVVRAGEDLASAVMTALSYDRSVVIEQFVAGDEVAVVVVDVDGSPVALPPVQVQFPGEFFDYNAHYTAGIATFSAPPDLPAENIERVMSDAVAAHRVLGMRHISRSDFIIDSTGEPQYLETAVSPGVTYTSTLPRALEAGGIELGALMAQLVAHATTGA